MTDERKNEIWAMLTQEEKDEFQSLYKCRNSKFDIGFNIALDEIFGTHNLTAQAEEKPTEEETVKERGISEKFPIDYTQYRLDLAKELAVAGISHQNPPRDLNNFAEGVVIIADEIIKRLKETNI